MKINRREFLILTMGLAAGCGELPPEAEHIRRMVNIGPGNRYPQDGVYPDFRNQGLFIVRRGEKLFALSSICTHQNCKLIAEPDRSFYCKCHGSTFDPDGRVTRGPAKRDLPVLELTSNDQGELVVVVPGL